MHKPKQVHKTREQLLADLKKNKQFMEKMKFTKEVFFPALIKATNSIEDALQNLSVINSIIMEKFLDLMKEKTMKDLDVTSRLSGKDPKTEEMKAMLALFDDMTVFDAKDLMEGMKNEINLFLTEENKNRKLSELKPRWLDELDLEIK